MPRKNKGQTVNPNKTKVSHSEMSADHIRIEMITKLKR